MDQALSALVWQRAASVCEYCRLSQSCSSIPFEIDNIIARKHGGLTEEANLALSCFYCNSHKGGTRGETFDYAIMVRHSFLSSSYK